jgi:hypothetical protein
LGGLGIEKVGKFFGHLEKITAIGYILWPFGNLVAIWCIFPHVGKLCREKSGNHALLQQSHFLQLLPPLLCGFPEKKKIVKNFPENMTNFQKQNLKRSLLIKFSKVTKG